MTPASGTDIREIDAAVDALLAGRDERITFLTPTWLRTWLAEFGERYQPVFIDCGTEAKPLAVAPLMLDDGRLTFIGNPEICDFMDFAIAADAGTEDYAGLWQRICALDWNELDLWGLRAGSPTRAALKELAAASACSVVEEQEAVAPRMALPDTWDGYVEGLGKKDRHELRRKFRRLFDSGADVRLEVFESQSDVVGAMDAFLDLHTRSRMDKTEFMTAEMTSFFRRMASTMSEAGLVRLFMVFVNDRPAASVFCFDAGSYLYMYNSGYDPDYSNLSVGLVSKALCIKWAIENGKTGIDFLRGNEPYKYDLGAKDQAIYRLIVRRPA